MEPLSPPSQPEEEWHLGVDPEALDHDAFADAPPAIDPSADRLEKPVAVLTVEHLAWILIASWTLLTRFAFLGARPLNASEARDALFAYDLASRTDEAAAAGFHPFAAGWIHLAQAGIFALGGANDLTARLLFVLSGMLLLAMTFELRHYIGRAGAIGMGALLALSPTVTWFSRANAIAITGAALAIVAIAVFMALCAQPTRRRAAALGLASGLLIASGPTGCILAASLIGSLALCGIGAFFVTGNAWLRARVWLDRYRRLVLVVVVTALVFCFASQHAVGLPLRGLADSFAILAAPRIANFVPGLRALLLPLAFYEFMIALATLAGIVVVCALRVRARFARFTAIWTVLSFVLYLSLPDPDPERILVVLLPAAILGGIALDYFHHTHYWRYGRYLIAVIALLTIFVQLAINFIHSSPDASAAAWSRHATLYWGQDATTIQTRDQGNAILKQVEPANRTVYHDGGWPPALRWYLRDLRPIESISDARVVVDTNQPSKLNLDPARTTQFEYVESWIAVPASLNNRRALRFFFLQEPWSAITAHPVALEVRPQGSGNAPTLIVPPSAP